MDKTSTPINFSNGLDTFTNKNELSIGQFVSLQNTIFVKTGSEGFGALQKRNGYPLLTTALLNGTPIGPSFLTTYSGGLTVIDSITAYSWASGPNKWTQTTGAYAGLQLSTKSVVRDSLNQSNPDCAISNNNLSCFAYSEIGSGTVATAKYVITDTATGSLVSGPTTITSSFGSVSSIIRTFSLPSQFVVLFASTISSGLSKLQCINISQTNVSSVSGVIDVATDLLPAFITGSGSAVNLGSVSSFDGVMASSTLFLSWSGGNGALRATSIGSSMVQGATLSVASCGAVGNIAMCADSLGSGSALAQQMTIWSVFGSGTSNVTQTILAQPLTFALAPKRGAFPVARDGSNPLITNVACCANNGILYTFNETFGSTGDPLTKWPRISELSISEAGGGPSTLAAFAPVGVGLASKAIYVNGSPYYLATHDSQYQSTYFLIKETKPVGKVAYGNGGGVYRWGVPALNLVGSTMSVPYLFQLQISPVNKNTNVSSQTQTAGIYAQLGVNVVNFAFTNTSTVALETANNLHVNGGIVYHYDGTNLDELNFFLFPEAVTLTTSTATGSIAQGSYFYQVCYEWTDAKGNIFRSAPSVPVNTNIPASGNITITVTPPALTLKNQLGSVNNKPKVVIYRWSTNQQTYYQVTSIQIPPIYYTIGGGQYTYVDSAADASILGNSVLYTNGGVVENTAPPATSAMTLFDARMWLINAEDPNMLWFSQPIIESTPVEFSDLLTIFVPPTTGAQASTGPMKCIAPMDDKLIIFKDNTIYYINGTGPDLTGNNSQYSPPIFVAAGVGCSNQSSIVLTPLGLMFQSNKGIWLLGRDLSVKFIGQGVDLYSSANVLSALLIPQTTQVRFTLDNGLTLVYDYLANQWGTFNGIPGISACIYNGAHTYLDNVGSVFQETPGVYADNGVPVVMQFQTGFVNLGGMQSYVRAYRAYLLGNFKSPHTYSIQMAYDFDPTVLQTATVNPSNTAGSGSQVEQWQINFARQQCQSFQMTFQETSSGTSGAGLILSDMNIYWGSKNTYPRNISPKNRTG